MLNSITVSTDIPQESSIRNTDPFATATENGTFDFSQLPEKPRPINLEHKRSLDERSLSELLSPRLISPRPSSRTMETVKSLDVLLSSTQNTPRSVQASSEPHPMIADAWEALRRSLVYFRGKPVGTIAALDPSEDALNYNQVFVRDFFPSALAFLMNGEPEIVKHFLLKTLRLQAWEKRVDCFTLGEGVMPASFKVLHDPVRNSDTMIADFGESAIGRVAPVDSGFWWIILLRAYTKSTGDHFLADMPDCQRGMRLILTLCLSEGFDTFPTLLCADGCCMVDRRMGIYGYPIEIQALFFMALRCARILLKPEGGGKEFIERIDKRLHALSYHMRNYFWLDFQQLNNIYRYKTEEYSHTAVNKFNVIPDSITDWVFDFMPMTGGYFIGNVSPARMDFRWFCLGNCIAILSSLATPEQSMRIMDLIEERWEDLVGEMPLKVSYPALEGHEWRIVTGCDPKNTRWSYGNRLKFNRVCVKRRNGGFAMAQAMRSRLFPAVLRTRLAPSANVSSASSKRSFSSAGHDDAYETEKWKKITIAGIIACTALATYSLSGEHEHFEESPAYPYLHIRNKEFPWGPDGLFERKKHHSDH